MPIEFLKIGFTLSAQGPAKRILKKFLSLFFFFLLFIFFTPSSYAKNQIHVRGGNAFANYDGVTSGELRSMSLIDLEFEVLMDNRKSYFFRTSQAFNLEKTIFDYSYLGAGMKWYVFSKGMYFETTQGSTEYLMTSPKWRFYVGWEFGVAHVTLQTIGEILTIQTSTYDYGGTFGTIYNITQRIGLELNFSAQISTGFTTISTGAAVMRTTVGLSYFL